MNEKRLSRRQIVKMASAGSFAGIGGALSPWQVKSFGAPEDRRYLFIITATGGASITDSFLASTTGPGAFEASQIEQPAGSAFKCVIPLKNSIQGAVPMGNGFAQSLFVKKHMDDMVVMTQEVSSVNHVIAAKRSISGNNINAGGITLAEAMAIRHGNGLPIPNILMSASGYGQAGDNATISTLSRGQPVADPLMFAFATSGFEGLKGALNKTAIDKARELRNQLEKIAKNHQYYSASAKVQNYRSSRDNLVAALEKGNTISKLMILDDKNVKLADYGVKLTPSFQSLIEKFPKIASEEFEARLGLAFLAAKENISCALSVAPSQEPEITSAGTPNAPIGFDWSHNDHRGGQNTMWSYLLKGTDSLIDLLKETDIDGDPSKGKMWSKSLVYIATEFGRDRVKSGGSGHHLNNGSVIISPMLKGNKVYGGVDENGLTYGFDPKTGLPDTSRHMREEDVYSSIAQALDIDFDGRHNMATVVKAT